jgi:hypothetical protein
MGESTTDSVVDSKADDFKRFSANASKQKALSRINRASLQRPFSSEAGRETTKIARMEDTFLQALFPNTLATERKLWQ